MTTTNGTYLINIFFLLMRSIESFWVSSKSIKFPVYKYKLMGFGYKLSIVKHGFIFWYNKTYNMSV